MFRFLLDWGKRNLTYVFSALGIALTIYFSIFYVPTYMKEARQERLARINTELVEDVQALVYAATPIDTVWLRTLIRGKEIRYNLNYPYTLQELLIQVQEQFIANKFISIDERRLLFLRVDSLRSRIPRRSSAEAKGGRATLDWISLIPAAFGLLLSLFGVLSLYYFRRRQRLEEIVSGLAQQAGEIETAVKRGIRFVDSVEQALRRVLDNKAVVRVLDPDFGVDFIIETKTGFAGVFAKSQTDPIQVGRLRSLEAHQQAFEAPDIVIVSDTHIMDLEKEQYRRIAQGGGLHFLEVKDEPSLEAGLRAIIRRIELRNVE